MRRITATGSGSQAAASNGNGSATAAPDADKAAAQQAAAQQQQQQAAAVADAGGRIAGGLKRDIVRKTLLAAVNSVKRADLATAASDPHGRAVERVNAAALDTLISDLSAIRDGMKTLTGAPYKVLKSANVGTRTGSVSALSLLLAIADASSKADALAGFAAE
jgi:hypothetical protein